MTSQAQNGATAQQSVMTTAQTAQQSVSGVNLDQALEAIATHFETEAREIAK